MRYRFGELHSGELWPARMLFEDGQGRGWQCRNGASSVGNSGGVGLGAMNWEVVCKVENASECVHGMAA